MSDEAIQAAPVAGAQAPASERLMPCPVVWWQVLILVVVTLGCLLPFINKAVHMDDPLFIWAAQHIQKAPINFYDFKVNWYGMTQPAWEVIQNPPLWSYYLAMVGSIFGWSEISLHLAALLPALAAVLGTFVLARWYCSNPLLAALATLLTPAFLVSSTTLMCDVMMLAFWVWALVFWERGLSQNRFFSLACAGLLAALCTLTKYPGICLLPLMVAYAVTRRAKLAKWTVGVLIPLLILAGFHWATQKLYGRSLLLAAFKYASGGSPLTHSHWIPTLGTGLAFAGGGFVSVLFFAPWLWRTGALLGGSALVALAIFALPDQGIGKMTWGNAAQGAVFVLAGLSIVVLVVADLWKSRDQIGLMLFLWVLGIIAYGSALNWTVNVRSFLPLAPALGILMARRVGRRAGLLFQAGLKGTPKYIDSSSDALITVGRTAEFCWSGLRGWGWPLLPAVLISLLVAKADYNFANANVVLAEELTSRYQSHTSTLWFQGHWGFQYYMEKFGATPVDFEASTLQREDMVIVPGNNSNVFALPLGSFTPVNLVQRSANEFLATLSDEAGLGFYASVYGPMPYAFCRVPTEKYAIVRILRTGSPKVEAQAAQ